MSDSPPHKSQPPEGERVDSKEDSPSGVAVNLLERAAPVAGLGLTAIAVGAAIDASSFVASVLAPVAGTAVAGLIPLVVEVGRHRAAEKSKRSVRARATARRAWVEEAAKHGRKVAV